MHDNPTDRLVLVPGPDHPITVTPASGQVLATVDERTIADSARALTLREEGFPPVQYIPRADVDFTLLDATDHETYCPYKGVAHYFSIRMGDVVLDNAVWTYEAPYPAVAEIKGHLAFYTDRVTVAERTVD